MNICLCVTNFKNNLVEAISKTAVESALLLSDKAEFVLFTPGEIDAGVRAETRLENVSYAAPQDYHSKVRVFRNIVALGRHLRSNPRAFDIVHFHVGNLLELFLIRMLLPTLNAMTIVTVWQPYVGMGEFVRFPWAFRGQLPTVVHHCLFNSWLLIPFFWFGAGYFDRIVVHTQHQLRQLPFIPRRKIEVIENGVTAQAPSATRPETRPPGVLYVGHATAVKGLDVLLAALGRARNRAQFRVTLALTEFRNVDVERLVRLNRLEDRVTVKGHVDVFDEMHHHDILVIPHKTSVGTSCYPNIALEAFSAGIPVVASATDVLAEIIEDRITGFLVTPGDVAALERVLVDLLNRPPADTKTMARKQQEAFRHRFTLDRYAGRYLKMYEGLLNAHAATAPGASRQHP